MFELWHSRSRREVLSMTGREERQARPVRRKAKPNQAVTREKIHEILRAQANGAIKDSVGDASVSGKKRERHLVIGSCV